ncbi:5-formyltetrahydrofolate cyclo-ligase isoform X1 [Prionailurus iriomotensis]
MVIAHSQYQKSKRISIFLSMQDEVETGEIIRDIFRQGKTCFVPRYRFQNNHMEMLRLTSPDEISLLPRTSWNILQPGEDEVREEALSTEALCVGAESSRNDHKEDFPSQPKPSTVVAVARPLKECGGLDLIFVPGLGFDKHGNRLGRGKGYYDSYLTRCLQQQDSKPYTVALAFREQMCLRVPVDEHDVRVDEVLYEDST